MAQILEHPMRRASDLNDVPPVEKREASRLAHWFERWFLVIVVGATAVFVTTLVVFQIRPAVFQPLDYGTQRVVVVDADGDDVSVPQVEGSDLIPSIKVGGVVPVIGDVCNSHDENVDISGVVQWNRLTPRGFNVETGRGTNSLPPGCKSLGPFENMMPQAVIDDVLRAGEPELWEISGVVSIDERNGGQAFWRTEAFWVVP